MVIKDGTGTGKNLKITDKNMARTYSVSEREIAYTSEVEGQTYSWTAAYDYTGGDTILWLRNDNTEFDLVIEKIVMASDTTTRFTMHGPSDTTAAGTDITGVNQNRRSNNTALATAKQDETGNTQGDIIGEGIILQNTTIPAEIDGAIVLGYLNEIGIDFLTTGTFGSVSIVGYYHVL